MQSIIKQIEQLKAAGCTPIQIYEAIVMDQEAGKTSSAVNGKKPTKSPRKV